MSKVFIMALIGLVMGTLVITTFAAHLAHTAPKEDSNAYMNRFVSYKAENDPFTTYWLTMQADVQISGDLSSWFLYFYQPNQIYNFDLQNMGFLSNRGYFYDPSKPSVVFIYDIRPKSAKVDGSAKYFTNFDYFYCGTQSLESYKSFNLSHDHKTHLQAPCTPIDSIVWSKGYFLSLWTWYASKNTADYTQNLSVYTLDGDLEFMYAGLNNIGVEFSAHAYGRSHIVTQPQTDNLPLLNFNTVTANVTHYVYNMNSPQYGYVLPYNNQYFSVKSVGKVPVCSIWNMRTKEGYSSRMYPFNSYHTHYTPIPKQYTIDGWIVTCTIGLEGQTKDSASRWHAWAQFRVHDISSSKFSFKVPEFSTEYAGALSDPWQDYQQVTLEFEWSFP